MAQDPSNILVAGNLRISTAPLGTTLPTALPTDPSTLNLDAAFKDLDELDRPEDLILADELDTIDKLAEDD